MKAKEYTMITIYDEEDPLNPQNRELRIFRKGEELGTFFGEKAVMLENILLKNKEMEEEKMAYKDYILRVGYFIPSNFGTKNPSGDVVKVYYDGKK